MEIRDANFKGFPLIKALNYPVSYTNYFSHLFNNQ